MWRPRFGLHGWRGSFQIRRIREWHDIASVGGFSPVNFEGEEGLDWEAGKAWLGRGAASSERARRCTPHHTTYDARFRGLGIWWWRSASMSSRAPLAALQRMHRTTGPHFTGITGIASSSTHCCRPDLIWRLIEPTRQQQSEAAGPEALLFWTGGGFVIKYAPTSADDLLPHPS